MLPVEVRMQSGKSCQPPHLAAEIAAFNYARNAFGSCQPSACGPRHTYDTSISDVYGICHTYIPHTVLTAVQKVAALHHTNRYGTLAT